MAKVPPAFQFYAMDFLTGTRLMTLPERGAYITLICHQWDEGGVTDNPGDLAKLFGCGKKEAERIWRSVLRKFERGADGVWRNARLEEERRKQTEYRAAQSQRGKASAKQRWQRLGYTEPLTEPITVVTRPLPHNDQPNSNSSSSSSSSIQIHDSPVAIKSTPPVPMEESPLRERFARFWARYPRKVGKGAAWRVWAKLQPSEPLLATMLASIESHRHSAQWRKEGGVFIPHPSTWLNQERWSDSAVIEIDPAGPLDGLKEFVRG